MNPEQLPQFNPQGPPQNQQGQWQQPNMQPFPPGPQNPQPPMSGPQHPMSGFPMPQQQQPSGLQSPRPQHPQSPPAFATAGIPQLNGMYSPPSQQGGQPQQHFSQAPGQQGPPPFPFPLADQQMMSPGPQRLVGMPGLVPPGAIPQPQQAQAGTPLGVGDVAGQPAHPSQQHTPHPPQTPLPPSMQQQQQAPSGNMPMPVPMGLGHPSGLAQHPLHQGMPPMAHQSIHGGSPNFPPAQSGRPAGNSAPSVHSVQAAEASAQQAHAMQNRGAEMSHDHIEAYNDRICDLRMKEVMELTARYQPNYVDPSEDELDRVLKESLKMYDEHQMQSFAKEREYIQAAVIRNLQQGGGSGRAGGAAPRAKRGSPASSMESKKSAAANDSPVNDPRGPPRASSAPSKREQSQTPVINNNPDGETADIVHDQQPATRNVNLERSKSPSRSPSRPHRHTRRRDAEWERWSSRQRDGAERWRRAGMYYSSGAYKGDILDNARVRHKRRGSQS
ncbi:hypothetical protein MBLNU13_g08683t1 [Cladosporium sp. NU13]